MPSCCYPLQHPAAGSLFSSVAITLAAVQGGYRALNRMGIDSSASPFLKISFETAAHFLTDATMRGATDELTSPASRLVGGPCS